MSSVESQNHSLDLNRLERVLHTPHTQSSSEGAAIQDPSLIWNQFIIIHSVDLSLGFEIATYRQDECAESWQRFGCHHLGDTIIIMGLICNYYLLQQG